MMGKALAGGGDYEGIETAETCAAVRASGGSYEAFAREAIRKRFGRVADLNLAHATGAPVLAHVNAGRWLWRCECGAANHVWLGGGNVCLECNNASTHGRPRVVVMPSAGQREQIERMLMMRRDKRTRNWQPGETLAEAWRDNLQNGEVG